MSAPKTTTSNTISNIDWSQTTVPGTIVQEWEQSITGISYSSDHRADWTQERWLEEILRLEQTYPEMAKALKLKESKLYRALK